MNKTTILLVDDEEDIRDVLSITLMDIGYTVLTAENGDQAYRIFKKENPSVVLTDIKMPGMNGVELLRKIKSVDPDTEVIMISGHGDMDLAIQSLKYDAMDFITKPINHDVLEIALKRANEKISMRRQLKEYTGNLEKLVKEQSEKLVEAERLAAVGQAVEGLSHAFSNIAGDLEGGIKYFNEMPCFVSIHNRNLKVVTANSLYRTRLRSDIGEPSWKIYKEADSATCPIKKTFDEQIGQRSEEVIRYADGEEASVIVYTAPIRNQSGEIELVLEISTDVSEITRLRKKLRKTEQRYQQLFDEVPCYITVQDKDFNITAANRRFKEDFSEGIGMLCYRTYKHRKEPCEGCPVARTFEDGKSHHTEMVVTAKSGEQYNVLIWTAPIRNAEGEITQVMEMSTNITQIRQLQDHLSSLGFLIGSISHGIKGLLTGLDGGMYLLNSGFAKENEDQIKEGWEIVKLMVERIRSMVLDILYYAKERELNWEDVDVAQFADDVAMTIEKKAEKNDIEFVRRIDRSIGKIEIDPSVVRSALINILENAVDACISDKSKKNHRIEFDVKQDAQNIIFDVRDNGMGMDRETRENIFTLFFSSKGKMGTGLGLFISHRIIEQHGGVIVVESEPKKGAFFHIEIPKSQPETDKPATLDLAPKNNTFSEKEAE